MNAHMIIYKPNAEDHLPISMGANGAVVTGATIVTTNSQQLQVRAVSLGRNSSHCSIGLPKDPDALCEVAATLLMIADDIDSKARRISTPITSRPEQCPSRLGSHNIDHPQ